MNSGLGPVERIVFTDADFGLSGITNCPETNTSEESLDAVRVCQLLERLIKRLKTKMGSVTFQIVILAVHPDSAQKVQKDTRKHFRF
jgi:hypothetical protein